MNHKGRPKEWIIWVRIFK